MSGWWRACGLPARPTARPGCHRKPWCLDGPRGRLDYGGSFPSSTEARAIEKQHRINEQIRITPIRVISAEGGQLGIIPTEEALSLAREAGLDLVEVAPNEKPPVCRIMDFGKFKYQQKKKQHKTHVHHTKIKEIRLRPKTGEHDIEFKVNQAKGFLQHKDKVVVSVVFRGRELAHIDEGQRVMKNILEQLDPVGKVESPPQQMGRRLVCTLTPK
jgi:translation initiation factor IF-3